MKNTKTPILVTLHGGCFTGGSHLWDQKQTKCLEKLGFNVRQLAFPTDNFEDTIVFLKNAIQEFGKKVYLLGRSSGGYLAKVIFDSCPDLIEKAIYLAPVFDPETRAMENPRFQKKQSYYFLNTTSYPTTDSFDLEKEVLFLAEKDENVPLKCFTQTQLENAIRLGIQTHCGLLQTTSSAFRDQILQVV